MVKIIKFVKVLKLYQKKNHGIKPRKVYNTDTKAAHLTGMMLGRLDMVSGECVVLTHVPFETFITNSSNFYSF